MYTRCPTFGAFSLGLRLVSLASGLQFVNVYVATVRIDQDDPWESDIWQEEVGGGNTVKTRDKCQVPSY